MPTASSVVAGDVSGVDLNCERVRFGLQRLNQTHPQSFVRNFLGLPQRYSGYGYHYGHPIYDGISLAFLASEWSAQRLNLSCLPTRDTDQDVMLTCTEQERRSKVQIGIVQAHAKSTLRAGESLWWIVRSSLRISMVC